MPGKTYRKTIELQQSKRRADVCALQLKGRTQREIAKELGISPTTVCHDLQAVLAMWRDRALDDVETLQREQLARLELIHSDALEGWERSLKDEVTVQESEGEWKGNDESKTVTTTRGQAGDPRFLGVRESVLTKQAKILGLEAPEKKDVNLRTSIDFDTLTGRSENPSNVVDGKIVQPESNGNGKPRLPAKRDE